MARKFINLPFPITMAVLPHKLYSVEISLLAKEKGKSVILHLPLEPIKETKEDKGTIKEKMR